MALKNVREKNNKEMAGGEVEEGFTTKTIMN